MVPMIATAILSGVGSFIKAGMKGRLSREQKDWATDLRAKADKEQAPPLSPEFQSAEAMRMMQAQKGLPGLEYYKEGIDSSMSDLAAKGKQAASSGGDYLAYLAGLYGNTSKAYLSLDASDAAYRDQAKDKYISTRWAVGQERKANEAIKRSEQHLLRGQADNLEMASTENKYKGQEEMIGSITSMAGSIAGAGGGGAGGGTGGGTDGGGSGDGLAARQGHPEYDVSPADQDRIGAQMMQDSINKGYTNSKGQVYEINPNTGAPNITYSTPEVGKSMSGKDYNYFKYGYGDTGTGSNPKQDPNFNYTPGIDKSMGSSVWDGRPANQPSAFDVYSESSYTPAAEEVSAGNKILSDFGQQPDGSMNDIKKVQGYLQGLGVYEGNIDGSYNQKTREALARYMKSNQDDFAPVDVFGLYGRSSVSPR